MSEQIRGRPILRISDRDHPMLPERAEDILQHAFKRLVWESATLVNWAQGNPQLDLSRFILAEMQPAIADQLSGCHAHDSELEPRPRRVGYQCGLLGYKPSRVIQRIRVPRLVSRDLGQRAVGINGGSIIRAQAAKPQPWST